MKLIFSILGLFALLPSGILLAATASSDAPPAYRYLILIDTSFSMARTKEATARTVRELIVTGVQGRMQRGDTVGIWTFNEKVETRRFPIYQWSPEQNESLAERAVYLFRKEKFEKQTRIEKALAEVFKAVQSTDSLTIFIISDGDEPIVGTPFDRSINAIYRQYARSLRREKKPFVTMFVAQDGALNSWSVHTGGSVIVLPDLPQPRRAVQEALAPTIVTNVALLPAPPVATTPPTAPPIETAKKDPAIDSAKEPPPTQAPVALPPASKQVEAVAATPLPPGAAGPEIAKPIAQPEPSAPPSAPSPDILKPSTATQTATHLPSTVPSEGSPPTKAPAAKEPTEPAKPAVAEIIIRKATGSPAAKTTSTQPKASVTPPSATPPTFEPASGQASERPPAQSTPPTAVAAKDGSTPPPAAVIAPSDQNVASWRFLALGSLFVLITGLFLLYRNYRAPRQPSFISRSMNSEGK